MDIMMETHFDKIIINWTNSNQNETHGSHGFSNGTNDLLSLQKKSKLSTFQENIQFLFP